MEVDDAMDVDGGWDDAALDDPSFVDDAMEVDAEVVREALRTLSAARRGGPDVLGDPGTWPTWPGMWPETHSSTGARSHSALSAPFAPRPPKLAAAAPTASPTVGNTDLNPEDNKNAMTEITIVPDTNALVTKGGASLAMLLERFSNMNSTNSTNRVTSANGINNSIHHPTAPRVRLAVPRRVVLELDGLKSSTHSQNQKVAALARGVNKALVIRLDAQTRGVDISIKTSTAQLEVQGPGDAAAQRMEMRENGHCESPLGDEEIIFFCQTRRKKNEFVAFITGDANAAVSAMSHSSDRDTPVCAFHPDRLPRNAIELGDVLKNFYQSVNAKNAQADGDVGDTSRAVPGDIPSRDISDTTERMASNTPRAVLGGTSRTNNTPTAVRTETAQEKSSVITSPLCSPRAYAVRALDALDDALPKAVEMVLRNELGNLWASGVSDDFSQSGSQLTPNDAFETLRKNTASLLGGGPLRRAKDGGREAVRLLGSARRARGTHAELRELGSKTRGLEVVGVVRDVLAGCPTDLPEVRVATATAAKAAARLGETR
tara:strand:+ start:27228 stop:28865 length:1638 start_codon:yes stop_codon:yes gene_type:complete